MGCSGSKDNAVIKENAVIKDKEVIKDNDVIKDNGVIKDNAVIKDSDVVQSQQVQTQQLINRIGVSETDQKLLYEEVDKHARNAPDSVKKSIEDLVNYLSTPSKQPKILVRAFFVWMSENVRYDVDGFFERSAKAPNDALSVIKNGKCVCEGYANVMEALCRRANINVKKISGYAKGFGHSEDHVITTNEDTNHAWNAVELDGKWYLLDATWGAGHLNSQNVFEKEFEDFYFLVGPEKLINTHFPYMNNDMESSMKWQLLKNPVSLDKFNKGVRRSPVAYNLDVHPVSHVQGYIEVEGRFEISFKIAGQENIVLIEDLMHYEGSMILEIQNTTFGQREGNRYKILVCPPLEGKYDLTLYGKKAGQDGKLSQLFKYLVKCKKSSNTDFRYPKAYTQAQIDHCILHEPLQNNLKPNSEVKVSLSSPVLLRVMINQTFLKKTGNKFEGTFKTGASGTQMSVYGSRVESDTLGGLYVFDIK